MKGKIRSLLEWRSGAVRPEPLSLKDLNESDPSARAVLAILQLFGISGDANLDDAHVEKIGPTRVSFHDARLLEEDAPRSNHPLTEIKSENSIDRVRGVALNPRQTERVAAGVRFEFRVTVKVLDKDGDLVRDLLNGMRLLELDSLGGSGSRGYGKIRFLNLRKDTADIQADFEAMDPFASAPGVAA